MHGVQQLNLYSALCLRCIHFGNLFIVPIQCAYETDIQAKIC